jgi:hypothetical protein
MGQRFLHQLLFSKMKFSNHSPIGRKGETRERGRR